MITPLYELTQSNELTTKYTGSIIACGGIIIVHKTKKNKVSRPLNRYLAKAYAANTPSIN
ncbi:hypothetical protein D3C78_1311290 [compost metagenome]